MAKKAASKSTGTAKAAKPKAAASKKPAPKRDKKKPYTKSLLVQTLAERTGLTKQQVDDLFGTLTSMIEEELKKTGSGSLTLPGLLKIRRAEKKATKARQMKHPTTGEEITIAAKPKQTVVRARILKNLQDMVK